MWVLVRNLVMCTLAGIALAVLFLTPGGALVAAFNGLLVGVCAALGELRARGMDVSTAPAVPIRLIGSHADSIS
jgi:hypothetical protein